MKLLRTARNGMGTVGTTASIEDSAAMSDVRTHTSHTGYYCITVARRCVATVGSAG